MSKVITFSRVFPSYHPRKGQETNFVEMIWNGLNYLKLPVPKNKDLPDEFMWSISPLSNYGFKYHTIRKGNRWRIGDKFLPRVWSSKPYASKQITIAPDIEVKKIFEFEFIPSLWLDESAMLINGVNVVAKTFIELANNDGLDAMDFLHWFGEGMEMSTKRKGFKGQIICWNENINY